jgi:hypothetical protein
MLEGTIYIATGRTYIDEGLKSAASLKAVSPSVHVTLFSDTQTSSPYIDTTVMLDGDQRREERSASRVNGSEEVQTTRRPKGIFNKVYHMGQSPYERTLFLDTDTYVAADISELFSLLDRFDIAVAHAPHREPRSAAQRKKFHRIPSAFVVMNTGVILFKKSDRMAAFFSEWLRSYQEDVASLEYNDQTSFREALYQSDLRIATLPPEYNYRFRKRLCINGTLKVLHGRHPDLPIVARRADAWVARGITGALVPSKRSKLLKRAVSAWNIFCP